MKKGLVAVIAAVAIAFVAMPADAQDEMRIGLGFVNSSAPIGARIWVNPDMAIDAGIGFRHGEVYSFDSSLGKEDARDDKKLAFDFDGGVVIVMGGGETTKVWIRPGFAFSSDPDWDSSKGEWVSATTISLTGLLGVEHFFSDWFSIGAAHGIAFSSFDPGFDGSDSQTRISSTGIGISSLGFHVYPFDN